MQVALQRPDLWGGLAMSDDSEKEPYGKMRFNVLHKKSRAELSKVRDSATHPNRIEQRHIDFLFDDHENKEVRETSTKGWKGLRDWLVLVEDRLIRQADPKKGALHAARTAIRIMAEDMAVTLGVFAGVFASRASGRKKRSRVVVPPGYAVLHLLKFIFSKRAFDTVFSQVIIDMREEYFEALEAGKIGKARWIVLRDHLGILLTVVTYLAARVGKKVLGIWKMIP